MAVKRVAAALLTVGSLAVATPAIAAMPDRATGSHKPVPAMCGHYQPTIRITAAGATVTETFVRCPRAGIGSWVALSGSRSAHRGHYRQADPGRREKA